MNFGDLLRSERKDYFYIMHLSYGTNKAERERLWNYAIDKKMIGLDLPDIVRKRARVITLSFYSFIILLQSCGFLHSARAIANK